jgi:hypothetical protein
MPLVVQGRGDAQEGGGTFLLKRVDHREDIGGTVARDVGACYGARSVALSVKRPWSGRSGACHSLFCRA